MTGMAGGEGDGRRHAPATVRNRQPILAVLARLLPASAGRVLEVAAGTGEHAVFFARALPHLHWLPTDADPACLASIAAHRAAARAGAIDASDEPAPAPSPPGSPALASPAPSSPALANLAPPLALDAARRPWPALPGQPFDAVVAINMIHIAPWEACLGLMAGAAAALRDGGRLLLYGPFMVDGRHTADSNAAFDASLRAIDRRFGVRDVAAVAAAAAACGLAATERVAMPANNLTLVFERRGGPG